MGITKHFSRQWNRRRFTWRNLRIRKKTMVLHTVSPGETLCAIALKYYKDASRWEEIFHANQPALRRPDMIHSGLQLVIPGAS